MFRSNLKNIAANFNNIPVLTNQRTIRYLKTSLKVMLGGFKGDQSKHAF